MDDLIDMTIDGATYLALIVLSPLWFPVWIFRKLKEHWYA